VKNFVKNYLKIKLTDYYQCCMARFNQCYRWVSSLLRTSQYMVYRYRSALADTNIWAAELEMLNEIPRSGIYSLTEPLTNELESCEGRNFLGYPAGGGIQKDGVPIGWFYENYVRLGKDQIFAFQTLTDLKTNFPLVFDRYHPEVVFDFGTAHGASALLFRQLMLRYCQDPLVVSVDIQDLFQGKCGPLHLKHKTSSLIEFHVGDTLSVDIFSVVQRTCEQNQHKRILLSLDDAHFADHVYRELVLYCPLLKSGDVIIVQDTWDQGMYKHIFSPLLAVLRFISEYPKFRIDTDLLRNVTLPCSFVHGILVKR